LEEKILELRKYYKDNPKKKRIFCEKGMKTYASTHITLLKIEGDMVIYAHGKGEDLIHTERMLWLKDFILNYEEIDY
jgi:hypothetical protein